MIYLKCIFTLDQSTFKHALIPFEISAPKQNFSCGFDCCTVASLLCKRTKTRVCCLCAGGEHALTLIEENLSAVVVLPRTGYVKGRPVVAVMSLHEGASINHELNTV